MCHVIAIDGPAGAGKSTVARLLAKELGFLFLDTGALYRALTYKALQKEINLEDERELAALYGETAIDLQVAPKGLRVMLDGEDVTEEIRRPEVTRNTFYIARSPRVRQLLLPLQREFARKSNLVAEGRDTTTVIFPEATLKVYLDATPETRALRRQQDLQKTGIKQSSAEVEREVRERDRHDISRAVAPLRKAPDAVYLDSSRMTITEEVVFLARLFRERTGAV